jgi:hypothetical protein
MAGIAAVGAVISYLDGLYLVHLAGATGHAAYLYPLLPDGLIVISTESMYDAAQSGQSRPRWATTGIVLGAVLTVAMNVAAGAGIKVPLALVDGVVPVVFFVALEILIGLIRRGRGGAFPSADPGAAPATPSQPEPPEPVTTDQALAVLLETASQRSLADMLGVPRSRVTAWAARVAPVADELPPGARSDPPPAPGGADPPAGVLAPSASPTAPAGAGLNGGAHG